MAYLCLYFPPLEFGPWLLTTRSITRAGNSGLSGPSLWSSTIRLRDGNWYADYYRSVPY